jgi:hypothetical protein
MCCHFADAECSFIELKDKWQQEVADEVLDFVRKKAKKTGALNGG